MPFLQSLSNIFGGGGRAQSRTEEGFSLPTTQFDQTSSLAAGGQDTPGPSNRSYPPRGQQDYPPLSHTFHRLRNALEDAFPELIESLNPPAMGGEIADFERELGQPLPHAVRESFLIADGQDLNANCQGLFYGLYLLPLEEVRREWLFWRQAETDPSTGANPAVLATMASIPSQWVKSEYACRGWLPMISDRTGNYVGVDLDPGQGGSWGQTIIFGRDFDRKCVVWRGEGEGGWGKFFASIVDDIESEGWDKADKSSDDEEEIGYSSYSGEQMYGDRGEGMRLTGQYKGWAVLEAWWDKSVRKWEELGLGMDVAEIERGLEMARRLVTGGGDAKGKGKDSERNSIDLANIASIRAGATADADIPVISSGSPDRSPSLPEPGMGDDQTLLPPSSPDAGAVPRILHPSTSPARVRTDKHPLEEGSSDFLLPPSHTSSRGQQQRRARPPPPPAQALDLPTRADVQAAQAVAEAETRGMRGGWVMNLEAGAGATNRRRAHNVSPSLDAEMVDIDLEAGRQEAFGTPPMSALDDSRQDEEDRLSMAGVEHRRESRSPQLLTMSRTPSPLSRPDSPQATPLSPAGTGAAAIAPSPRRGPAFKASPLTSPAHTSPPSLAQAAAGAIRRPEPVVGVGRTVSPSPDMDTGRDVIRGMNDRRRSSATPTPTGSLAPSRENSLVMGDQQTDALLDGRSTTPATASSQAVTPVTAPTSVPGSPVKKVASVVTSPTAGAAAPHLPKVNGHGRDVASVADGLEEVKLS